MFLIVGADGQLGSALLEVLGGRAAGVDRAQLDITDASAVSAFLAKNRFEAVVNCAAYTAVDKAEDEPELAAKINVEGARNLAVAGTPLIHVSTDYVFSGDAFRPYRESDAPAPRSVYGKTKLAGERAVLETAGTACVVRTAWLYSPVGNNFVKTMRRLGAPPARRIWLKRSRRCSRGCARERARFTISRTRVSARGMTSRKPSWNCPG